jgi:hypothetical protein
MADALKAAKGPHDYDGAFLYRQDELSHMIITKIRSIFQKIAKKF